MKQKMLDALKKISPELLGTFQQVRLESRHVTVSTHLSEPLIDFCYKNKIKMTPTMVKFMNAEIYIDDVLFRIVINPQDRPL
tara:strand:+ start:2385 stop:2630 length:246 start_codon:yes stop_codon:yes gene_type:complete